jgi:hypothetical protein
MAKANDVETAKDQSRWNDPYGSWHLISAFIMSVQSAVRLYNAIHAHHGIASRLVWAVCLFCAPVVLWRRRRRRLRRERGIPDPDPIREGNYVPSMALPVFMLLLGASVVALATGSVAAWVGVGVISMGLVDLIGVSTVVGPESLMVRNSQFHRRRTIPYVEIGSLRIVHPSYPFTGSRVLEIGLRSGEMLRVRAISDDRIARSDVWARTVTSTEQRKVAPAPLLGKICEHTGLPIQTGVLR